MNNNLSPKVVGEEEDHTHKRKRRKITIPFCDIERISESGYAVDADAIIFKMFSRRGDTELFHIYNPEKILTDQEDEQEKQREQKQAIQRILEGLSKRDQEILWDILTDIPIKSIAKERGLSTRTIYKIWEKAMDIAYQLRRELET
jgi:DNA-directed RNA polymerase specialized sigma subunit